MRELFKSIFRVIVIFFLSVVDSNTCDKIRTIMAGITCNNARNIHLLILKVTSTDRQTRRLHIFKIFAFIWHQIIHKIILVYSN